MGQTSREVAEADARVSEIEASRLPLSREMREAMSSLGGVRVESTERVEGDGESPET